MLASTGPRPQKTHRMGPMGHAIYWGVCGEGKLSKGDTSLLEGVNHSCESN